MKLHQARLKTPGRVNRPGEPRQAMTLVEVVVAVALTALLASAMVSFIIYTGRTLAGLANYVDLNIVNRISVDKMSQEIRQARYLKTLGTNQISLVDYDGAELSYEYRPAEGTLVRNKGGETIVLKECNSLAFVGYKPNPTAGSFDLVTTTNPELATLVRMNWKCSRTAWGSKVNSEALQSASILIRKNQLRP